MWFQHKGVNAQTLEVQVQVGRGFEQPDQVKSVSAYGRGNGTGWSLSLFQPKPFSDYIFNVRLDKIFTNFGSNLSEGSMFGTSCHHQGLKFIFHAHETDLPLLFPQIEHLLMYTKYSLKWKLFNSCGYWSFVSELHYCSILKTTTGQVLMNVFYLLAKKEPQLIFSQDHHRSSAPLASFSSWDIPGQSTVTSGSLEMALNTDTEG